MTNHKANERQKVKSDAAQSQDICAVTNELTELQRKVAEKMLIEGATFEDAMEVVNEESEKKVTLRAIESYFRSDVRLQQKRILHMLQTARDLKQALANPESGRSDLAEAVLITGLMGLSRGDARLRFQGALRLKDQEENNRLKKEVFRLKNEKLDLDRRFLEVRLKTESAKRDLITSRLAQLKEAVERKGEDHVLGPDIIQQIQEIYGLVSVREPAKGSEASMNVQS